MKSLDVLSCEAAPCSEGGDRERWCDTDSILRKCGGNSGWLSVACAEMKQWKMRLRAKDCTRVLTRTCCARSLRQVRRSKWGSCSWQPVGSRRALGLLIPLIYRDLRNINSFCISQSIYGFVTSLLLTEAVS